MISDCCFVDQPVYPVCVMLRGSLFCRDSPQHSGVHVSSFGSESSFLPISDEHVHFNVSRCPERELEFGLSLFPNDGASESSGDPTNKRVDDVQKSGGRVYEESLAPGAPRVSFSYVCKYCFCLI